MKRISTLLLLGMTMGGTLFAKQVDEQTAATVAKNFIATQMSGAGKQTIKLISAYGAGTTSRTYYVFDLNDKSGFVVVAADDIVKPILAYSTTNEFLNSNNPSPETEYWMGLYDKQINFAIEHHITAAPEAVADWDYYTNHKGSTASKPTNVVTPLLTTTWNQGTYYNIYTPGVGSNKTPVGCVATAMAQIMKYWNAPTNGTGSYTYNHPTYGQQTANFGATTYQWGLMPDNLTSASSQPAKNAVSLLGYHCAVGVRMDFDPAGSGSQVIAWSNNAKCAENAFKNYFGYKTTIEGLSRDEYTDDQWDDILKGELDNARPVLYAGFGAVGGHAFVFDGYDAAGLFHINWGWGGMSNGYFTVNNLAPSALGIGGGGGNFNDGQQALVKIEPVQTGTYSFNIAMNGALSVSAGTINKGSAFSVTSSIWNRGTFDFGGGFAAGIYKAADSSFVTNVQSLNNQYLLTTEDTVITFNTNGISSLGAGEYFIKALYKQEGATGWSALPDDLGFVNHVNLSVIDTATPTGIVEVALGQSFSVYPNPARNQLSIDRSGFSGKVNALQLYNIQGQKISTITADHSAVTTIPVSQLAGGIYYLHILTDQGTATRKVIVQH